MSVGIDVMLQTVHVGKWSFGRDLTLQRLQGVRGSFGRDVILDSAMGKDSLWRDLMLETV